MQFQDNHMDELFRRAAENVPLKEADADWSAIYTKLNNNTVHHQEPDHRRFFFLLSFLGIVCMLSPLWLFETAIQQHMHPRMANNSYTEKPTINDRQTAVAVNLPNLLPQKVTNEQLLNNKRLLIADGQKYAATEPVKNVFPKMHKEVETSLRIEDVTKTKSQQTSVPVLAENKQLKLPGLNALHQKPDIKVEKLLVAVPASLPVTAPSKKSLSKPSKGWYAGVQAGMSFSMVKRQHITSPGFTAGLAVGYKLSSSWALETGLRFSEKKYYSNGEYFKPKAADPNMPVDMKVLSVNSKTLLLEIPVKAKYNFAQTKKGEFFLTGGINTFVVGKEINNYIIFRNGASGEMQATYDAKKSYLAATLELSAGFEKYLKNKHTLRIEPWLQIAQKGIGVGQLPVSGFGIQAGYFFHK